LKAANFSYPNVYLALPFVVTLEYLQDDWQQKIRTP